jgi:cytosine/adenosine deaminase-related metal-dependent hydrolase
MKLSDFWRRMGETFGPAYARSVAADQVLPQLERTAEEALRAGVETVVVWRAICANYPDRVPSRLR